MAILPTVTYSFEGGSNGSSVAQGAGAGPGDTPFDTVSIGTSCTDAYDSTRAAHGTLSCKIATSTTSASSYNGWTTSVGTQATVWLRAYLYFTAAPSVQHRVINLVGSGSSRGTILATTSGTLIFTDASGTTRLTSAAFPTGAWFRLEAKFTGDPAAGLWSYQIWHAPDSVATPDDTQATYPTLNTGGPCDTYRFGISANVASAGPFWMDDLGVSAAGFTGAAAAVAPARPRGEAGGSSGAGCEGPPPQTDYLVVVADMQPGATTSDPWLVVAEQVASLVPMPQAILLPGDCTNDGDNAGFSGEYAHFDTKYGSIKPLIRPVPGNHDWGNVVGQGNLNGYDGYWGQQGHPTATPPHFYSFDLPSGWHVIALDSDSQWLGSVSNPSATYTAVASDLAAHPGQPLIAFWHHPRFSDGTDTADPGGTNDNTVMTDIWDLLYDHHCDLVFSGHCHSYQRFAKLGKTGTADSAGIAEFIVGTGGSGLFTLEATQRSVVNSYQSAAYDQANSQWFGFLKLWLTPHTYSWQFVSQNATGSQAPGQVLDSGGPVTSNLYS